MVAIVLQENVPTVTVEPLLLIKILLMLVPNTLDGLRLAVNALSNMRAVETHMHSYIIPMGQMM